MRVIPLTQARALIETCEWLGTMPPSRFEFGIFFGDRGGGVVLYGDECVENLGVWDKYGFTGKIICPSRGACAHWAPPHAASKLIRQSMRMLPGYYKVVTATVDARAGEVGTIYQACGFDCVGTSRKERRALIGLNGKNMSERTAQQLVGDAGPSGHAPRFEWLRRAKEGKPKVIRRYHDACCATQ